MNKWTTLAAILAALLLGYDAGTRRPASAAAPVPADAAAPAPAGGGDHAFSAEFVRTAVPAQRLIDESVPVTGKLSLDKQQLRIASSRVAGRLGRIFVFEGQSVKAGEPLAEIYSPDFISAENEFLLARRFRDTLSGGDQELRDDAADTYRSAVNKLKVLGADDADIAALGRRGTAAQYLLVRAPIAGVVVQRNVDPGGYLNVGDTLMSLARLDTLWLYANLYEADYSALQVGEALDFETPALPGQPFTGRVSFVAPAFDPATHTLPIRCEIPNPDKRLRPEMFVSGRLLSGQRKGWVVPKTAIIHIRDSDYLIVKDDDRHYRRLAVQGHPLGQDEFAVVGGLDAPLNVVIDGGLLLNETVGSD